MGRCVRSVHASGGCMRAMSTDVQCDAARRDAARRGAARCGARELARAHAHTWAIKLTAGSFQTFSSATRKSTLRHSRSDVDEAVADNGLATGASKACATRNTTVCVHASERIVPQVREKKKCTVRPTRLLATINTFTKPLRPGVAPPSFRLHPNLRRRAHHRHHRRASLLQSEHALPATGIATKKRSAL